MAYVRQHRMHVVRDTEPDTVVDETRPVTPVAARLVYLVGGIITALLGLRFLLSLLGANRGNTFADFIYTTSHPFVAPFFGLFNYQEQFGVVRFEFETLVAMLFWGFVTWLIVQLIMLPAERR